MPSPVKVTPCRVGTVLLAALVSGVMVFATFERPSGIIGRADRLTGGHAHSSAAEAAQAPHGFTAGWLDGQTVEFFYTKDFFCQPPPTSGAPSQCEVGEDGMLEPRPGPIPTLYVMTPLGFRPAENTLHCPIVGSCINHPSTIDLSRIGGPSDAPLPAHSHVIDRKHGGWWELEVIGVKSPAVWDEIVAGKSLDTVRALQAADLAGRTITGDIPTNTYLFFNVRP